uniref:Uncharacterized protein n=1 Tax=Setaria digitata TaxID=48799 RepID=A0A915Q3H1_9BILA
MGLCCSADERHSEHLDCLEHQQQSAQSNLAPPNSPYGVGRGIAMMMQQATVLAGAPQGVDLLALEAEIRKAKAEGRTVTIANGCVYFDYRLVGRIPSDNSFQR